MENNKEISVLDNIQSKIYTIRGQKVMLDIDLAYFYQVRAKDLRQQVRRNIESFPEDFMWILDALEKKYVATICGNMQRILKSPSFPMVFTEHGVLMLSSVLKSKKAVDINIKIVRTFVEMRKSIVTKPISKEIKSINNHLKNHDSKFEEAFAAIKYLLSAQDPNTELI